MNPLSQLKHRSPNLAALFHRKLGKEPISVGARFQHHLEIHKSIVYRGSVGLLIVVTLLAGPWLRAAEPSKPSAKGAVNEMRAAFKSLR